MTRISQQQVAMQLAESVSNRSLCSSRKVGAVVMNKGRIVSSGYNGPSKKFEHGGLPCDHWCKRQRNRATAKPDSYGLDCPSIHAEANALLYCDRQEHNDADLYVTSTPCADCAKLILGSGIARVFIGEDINTATNKDDIIAFLKDNGVEVYEEFS